MIKKIILATAILSFSAQNVYANSLNIRLEKPKSPTNLQNYKLTYVALDTEGRPVSVRCLKQGPGESGFSQFGASQNLIDGGNSSSCLLDSSVVSAKGTYNFKVVATAGEETTESQVVSVEYQTDGPSSPNDYQKEQLNSCTYRIKFKTADDSGKTVRVDLFRSTDTNLTADNSSRVGSLNIGSNTTGFIDNTVSDCSKTNYFAIRSFDSAGNGSGLVGDSFTTVVTSTSTNTLAPNSLSGAILTRNSQVRSGGEVLGKSDSDSTTSATEGSTPSATPTNESVLGTSTSKKNYLWLIIVAVITIAGYVIFNKKPKIK